MNIFALITIVLLVYVIYHVAKERKLKLSDAITLLTATASAYYSTRQPSTLVTSQTSNNATPIPTSDIQVVTSIASSSGIAQHVPLLVWFSNFLNGMPRETWFWLIGTIGLLVFSIGMILLFNIPDQSSYDVDPPWPFIFICILLSILICTQIWGGLGVLWGFLIGSFSVSLIMIPFVSSAIIGATIGAYLGSSVVLFYLAIGRIFEGSYVLTGFFVGTFLGLLFGLVFRGNGVEGY